MREKKIDKQCLRAVDLSSSLMVVGTLDKKVHLINIEKDDESVVKTFDFFDTNIYSVKILP